MRLQDVQSDSSFGLELVPPHRKNPFFYFAWLSKEVSKLDNSDRSRLTIYQIYAGQLGVHFPMAQLISLKVWRYDYLLAGDLSLSRVEILSIRLVSMSLMGSQVLEGGWSGSQFIIFRSIIQNCIINWNSDLELLKYACNKQRGGVMRRCFFNQGLRNKNNKETLQLKLSDQKMSEQIETHVLAKYKVIKKIGSGAYGHVYKVQDRKTKAIKALKKNFDAFNNSTDAQRTYREIMFLMELKHPNIIVLEEVIPAENGKDIYLVFEHMDADLHLLIRQNILAEKHKKYILYQAARAVLFLHSAGLIHRDLKPSNILVNQSCEAKLCDFGLVRSIQDQKDQAQNQFDILTEYIATRWYRAPEILLGSRGYSKGIDIWGFGCLVAEMAKGKPIFQGTSTINQLERVLMWTGPPTQSDIESLKTNFGREVLEVVSRTKKASKKQFFTEIDPECLDLISRCLQFNPAKRISIEQIIKHPYLSEFYDKSEIVMSSKKMKVPIDDNRRLSLRDYRSLIYDEIKKRNKSTSNFSIPFNQVLQQDSTMYRIREKPKKTIRTQQSEQTMKEKQSALKEAAIKKPSINYENESKTVQIKKAENLKKKTFYKAESLQHKNLKTIEQEQQKLKEKEKEKVKKDILLGDVRKVGLFKESNSAGKQWNKGKRSMTEGDSKKDSKMFATYMDVVNMYKK